MIGKLLDRNVIGSTELKAQIPKSFVYSVNLDASILRFEFFDDVVSANVPYGQDVAVEANSKDLDGCPIEVLLHVKDGKLYELEYLRVDGGPISNMPNSETLSDFIIRH